MSKPWDSLVYKQWWQLRIIINSWTWGHLRHIIIQGRDMLTRVHIRFLSMKSITFHKSKFNYCLKSRKAYPCLFDYLVLIFEAWRAWNNLSQYYGGKKSSFIYCYHKVEKRSFDKIYTLCWTFDLKYPILKRLWFWKTYVRSGYIRLCVEYHQTTLWNLLCNLEN